MCQDQEQQHQQQQQQRHPFISPAPVPFQSSPSSRPRPESLSQPTKRSSDLGPTPRKRPFVSAPEPSVSTPRPIQPRPPPSTSITGANDGSRRSSAIPSSPLDDPSSKPELPRKRGRPSKAETERRRSELQARYPPARLISVRPKIPSTPTSPEAHAFPQMPVTQMGAPPPQQHQQQHQQQQHADPWTFRQLETLGDVERTRRFSDTSDRSYRGLGLTRQLPRPPELRQPLPSPSALPLGQRGESIPRLRIGGEALLNPSPEEMQSADVRRWGRVSSTSERTDRSSVSGSERRAGSD